MKNPFSFDEIVEFAVKIEENGEAAYRKFAEKFKEKEDFKLYEFFKNLADQEIEHKKIFMNMLKKNEGLNLENTNTEYYDYFKSYVYDMVFPKEKLENAVNNISDLNKALQFAIRMELDSIMFYMDMKNLFGDKIKSDIDKIIEEERRHYLSLKNKAL